MNIDLNGLLKSLGDFSIYSTIATVFIGAISPAIQSFTITKKDFKKRVALDKENLIEKLISSNRKIFKTIYFPDLSKSNEEDFNNLITENVKEDIRVHRFIMNLDQLYNNLCRLYNYCLYSIIFGIILFLISIIVNDFKPYSFLISILIIITQFIAIIRITSSENRLEDYEAKI